MSPRFTPETEQAMRAAGWFPERSVEWEQMCDWAIVNWSNNDFPSRDGYLPRGYSKISPAAWQILEEFGGLSVRRMTGDKRKHPFIINPLLVPDCATYERGLELFVWIIGVDIFPLGMIQTDAETESPVHRDQVIAVSDDGRVFSLGYPNFLLGHSFEAALEKIVAGEKGEEIEFPAHAQPEHMVMAVEWRILQRDIQLIKGELPDEPKIRVHDSTTSIDSIRDWEAEAALIMRAFGLTEPCVFVGSRHRKTLRPIIENRSLNNLFPSLGNGFCLGVTYDSRNRLFQLKNVSHDILHYNDITVFARWNGEAAASYHCQPQKAEITLILAKGLFHFAKGLCHLGFLTPEVEAELNLAITQHEKLEWQLEFEAFNRSA